ncbi:uncharacterized protein EDB91DRAFT_1140194, partial [Suillus paluster]|uniref:uncharacterized protein n=1 Tax=Suillus paluster TaxID=48578 RepID=UPI001B86B0F9
MVFTMSADLKALRLTFCFTDIFLLTRMIHAAGVPHTSISGLVFGASWVSHLHALEPRFMGNHQDEPRVHARLWNL